MKHSIVGLIGTVFCLVLLTEGSASLGPGSYMMEFAGPVADALTDDTTPSGRLESFEQVDDAYWHPGHGVNGVDGSIAAIAQDSNGNVYVAGGFSLLGSMSVNNIARWDGIAWQPLGEGTNGYISSMVIGTDGTVYVAGRFSQAGGLPAAHVAAWDGSGWREVGGGTDNHVTALALSVDQKLYAAGTFASAGGRSAARLAAWDGQTWSEVGGGFRDHIYSLAVGPDANVYVGGYFQVSSGSASTNVAYWDGRFWRVMESGTDGYVLALHVSEDNRVFAGGRFDRAGTAAAQNIAVWVDGKWHSLGDGVARRVEHIDLSAAGEVYVAGGFFEPDIHSNEHSIFSRWDGLRWHDIARGEGIASTFLLGSNDRIYLGGGFTSIENTPATSLAIYARKAWEAVASGTTGSGSARAWAIDSKGRVIVSGQFAMIAGTAAGGMAYLDGHEWHPFPGGAITGSISAIVVDSNDQVIIGGRFLLPGETEYANTARWDGIAWKPIGDEVQNQLSSVQLLALGNQSDLYAIGRSPQAAGGEVTQLSHWDGLNWNTIDTGPHVGGYALGVDAFGRPIVGSQAWDAGVLKRIAVWNGIAWEALGGDVMSPGNWSSVRAISRQPNGDLIIAGNFSRAGQTMAENIALWDGTAWIPFGDGLDGMVTSVATAPDGTVYAGGHFLMAGSEPASHIARWDGSRWHALESGLDGPPSRLLTDEKGGLHVTGNFRRAGEHVSAYFAYWGPARSVSAEPLGTLDFAEVRMGHVYPNPTTTDATVEIEITSPQHFQVVVYDLLGRSVVTVHDGYLSASTHRINLGLNGLPAGTYVVRAEGPDARVARMFTRLP